MKQIFIIMIASTALLLSGCGKSSVSRSAPTKSERVYESQVPLGEGGVQKTGNPYQIAGRWYYPLTTADGYDKTGIASWYGTKFHGKKTANGERYDMHAMSAAHTTLPMPCMVRVTNLENGRSVIVRVNDRGPFVKDRIIDLSYAAAKALNYDAAGTTRVRVQALSNSAAVSPAPHSRPAEVQPAPLPPAPAITTTTRRGAMYIQLGAFSSHANATRLKNELQSSYPSVNIYSRNGGYSEIYRVRIGPFDDEKSIEKHVLSLQDHGYANAIVVIE